MSKTGPNRINWIYWVRPVGSTQLLGSPKGVLGRDLHKIYGIDQSHLISMRNSLLSRLSKGAVDPLLKKLRTTKAVTTAGKDIRVELVAVFNPETNKQYIDNALALPPKGTAYKQYGFYKVKIRNGHKKTIEGAIESLKAAKTLPRLKTKEEHLATRRANYQRRKSYIDKYKDLDPRKGMMGISLPDSLMSKN